MKQAFLFMLAVFLIVFTPFIVYANQQFSASPSQAEIFGTLLLAETREPIVGASIIVKGTKTGAKSNLEGHFSIQANIGDILVISCIGIESYELKIDRNNLGIITLKAAASSLDEVQIIGYGQTSKRNSTGNISSIKAADIARQPVNNPLLALEASVPGLYITQSTGYAGGGVNVQIQGQNSLSFRVGNDPLYVIDGVPYPSRLLWTTKTVLGTSGTQSPTTLDGLIAGAGSPFSFINPTDIESIDILKDADATAIFGSRAANGAILITTKKGKPGKTKVDFNIQRGWGKVTHMLDLLNTQQYLEMRHEALRNTTSTPGDYDYDLNGTWDTTRYTNWQKKLIGGTAHITNIQGNISGGNENTQFLIGTGYRKETTVFPSDVYDEKASLRFNLNNVSSNQKFRFQLSGAYMVDKNQLLQKDLTNIAVTLAPVAPDLNKSDGSLNWAPDASGNSTWINPLSYLYNRYTVKTTNLMSSAVISYEILPGLDIKTNFGFGSLQSNEIGIEPSLSIPPEFRSFYERTSSFNHGNINSWLIEPQINFKKEIGKGRLEALVGGTIQQNNTTLQTEYGRGYANDLVLGNISNAQNVSNAKQSSSYRYNALFGRINYNWKEKYIINLTARRDGSSRFGLRNQFHNFGAVGIGWIFSNENFAQQNLSILSFGKFRASYGSTGNDQFSDYKYLSAYKNTTVPIPYQGAVGLTPYNLPNSYLQWEETRKLQFGLDLGFLKDRILLNANYYQNRSSNQLLSSPLPIMTGFESIEYRNFPAIVQNYGWEFTLSTTNIRDRDVSWTSNINLSLPKNKLLSFPNLTASSLSNTLIIGEPITTLKIYHAAGVDPATGNYQVVDKDGKPTTYPNPTTDLTARVSPIPHLYGGFENNIQYKGFELDLLIQVVKQVRHNYLFGSSPAGYYYSGTLDLSSANQPISVLDRWQKPGDIKAMPKFDNSSNTASWSNANFSDAAYSDASYIRLRNLSLSWRLPEKWRNKIHLGNARLYILGQNLLTLTNYKGLDPETATPFGLLTLPPLKIWTTGIQVTL
ncbi:SusC/RagA family TonB-linked outer membrane protein [Chitinophaga sp. CF118]|uniref:SusC/RagA family TonB-linked outer membrane protein n=1 Tax=Chitinophaga sp. CF118 TaxID=1884367 RepID=UPI0015A6A980|nr:SusC/RagA family TonB-linked outer membrane protein [Chitinophaga sp. CF118]